MGKTARFAVIEERSLAMSTLAHGTGPASVLSDHVPHSTFPWRALAPLAVTAVLALCPAPEGLAQHAWYFFAIFAGVIVGLMLEPLPGGAIGVIGVTVVAMLAP